MNFDNPLPETTFPHLAGQIAGETTLGRFARNGVKMTRLFVGSLFYPQGKETGHLDIVKNAGKGALAAIPVAIGGAIFSGGLSIVSVIPRFGSALAQMGNVAGLGLAGMAAKVITGTLDQNSQVETLRNKVGPKLTAIATNLENIMKKQIERMIPEDTVNLVTNLVHPIVYPELVALQIIDNAEEVIKRTSPQMVGESLHAITDFFEKYRTAFSKLAGRQFGSAEAEGVAWKEEMGEYWHSVFNPKDQTIENRRITFVNYVDKTVTRIEKLLLPVTKVEVSSIPELKTVLQAGLNAGVRKLVHKYAEGNERVLENMIPFLDNIFNNLGQLPEMLHDKQALYAASLEGADKLIRTLTEYGLSIPEANSAIQQHEILVEQFGGQEVVFHCSDRAKDLGIKIGMEASVAEHIWNSGKLGYDPKASILADEAAFGDRKNLKQSLQIAIEAALSQAPGKLRNATCDRIKNIPYVGRPAALLFRAIWWMNSLSLKGVNLFIGIPSSKVLSEEIAQNLINHCSNPALVSAPFIYLDRLLDMLEGKNGGPVVDGTTNREAFLGELIIGLTKTFATLCPSLFKSRFPRLVAASTHMALWIVRKGVALGTLTLVNPLTRKVALKAINKFSGEQSHYVLADKAFRWVQGSAITLLGRKSSLEATHSILSQGYKTLGELGFVSNEQTHFERGNRSFADLIHHTILVAGRVFTSMEGAKEYFEFKVNCERLKKKMAAGEALTDDDTQIFVDRANEKRATLLMQFDEISQDIDQLNRIPQLRPSFDLWLNGNPEMNVEGHAIMKEDLEKSFTTWRAFEKLLSDKVAQQTQTTGEPMKDQVEMLSVVSAVRAEFEQLLASYERLINSPLNSETSKDLIKLFEKAMNAAHQQDQLKNQLFVYFSEIRTAKHNEVDQIQTQIAFRNRCETVSDWIDEMMVEKDAARFAHPRAQLETDLNIELQGYEEELRALEGVPEEIVAKFRNDENLQRMLLNAKKRFYDFHMPLKENVEMDIKTERKNRDAHQLNEALKSNLNPASQASLNLAYNFWSGLFTDYVKPVFNAKPVFDWVQGWQEEQGVGQEEKEITFDQIDFYQPEATKQYRADQAKVMAKIHGVSEKLHRLYTFENSKQMFMDPVWVLEQSSADLLPHAKRHLL